MPAEPRAAQPFSWRVVDAIRYCADITEKHAPGSGEVVARTRYAADQIAQQLPPRTVETFDMDIGKMQQGKT